MSQNPGENRETPTPIQWERGVIEKVLLSSLEEQRRARRWGIFFKFLLVGVLLVGMGVGSKSYLHLPEGEEGGQHTAVIDVAGLIAPGQPASADNIIEGLRDAVENPRTKGIILRMNSPGGSPVQAAYVYDEIRRLKRDHPDLPIHAVVVDMCASGGYYIAAAADRIYVSNASVIGSIGVIMGSFGFVDTMKMLGIERRVMTAGEHKALLDPFAPVDAVAHEHMQGVLGQVHRQFIDAVKQGRGDRLKPTPDMFSGLIWTGEESLKLGLADELGNARQVAEEVIGAKKLVSFNPDENLLDRLSRRFGGAVSQALVESLLMTGIH